MPRELRQRHKSPQHHYHLRSHGQPPQPPEPSEPSEPPPPFRAKSASDWTTEDLASLNIQTTFESMEDFFDTENPAGVPIDDEDVLGSLPEDYRNAQSNEAYFFLYYLGLADATNWEANVDEFSARLLYMHGYTARNKILRRQLSLHLPMCSERRTAIVNICLVDEDERVLFVEENKHRDTPTEDPGAQLIAGAIAAFAHNNELRERNGQPPLQSETIPAILLTGTSPIFYLIPVTRDFLNSIWSGVPPTTVTKVRACSLHIQSMKLPGDRLLAFKFYNEFKHLYVQ